MHRPALERASSTNYTSINGGITMATQVTIYDPAEAKAYFEAKMAFTTGPVELERMMKNSEVNVVDVRAAEDYAQGHIPGDQSAQGSVANIKRSAQRQDECPVLLFPSLSSRRDGRYRVCRERLSCHGI